MLILPWCSVFYHVPNTKVKELMDGYNIFGFSKVNLINQVVVEFCGKKN
ncbi:hypothetical protein GLYMA_02G111200v4 [Glycine max]|uniref:Uncharacterized protein n=1 Tax=Glycine max TaxID=3847 RepID=A0A0R0KVL1_SOYBN|nr:hypothetical protein GYH30_003687 [Glycine max]KRH70791.1 hypothetical protein GLYMA_02G111200v4 [Glycine max]